MPRVISCGWINNRPLDGVTGESAVSQACRGINEQCMDLIEACKLQDVKALLGSGKHKANYEYT